MVHSWNLHSQWNPLPHLSNCNFLTPWLKPFHVCIVLSGSLVPCTTKSFALAQHVEEFLFSFLDEFVVSLFWPRFNVAKIQLQSPVFFTVFMSVSRSSTLSTTSIAVDDPQLRSLYFLVFCVCFFKIHIFSFCPLDGLSTWFSSRCHQHRPDNNSCLIYAKCWIRFEFYIFEAPVINPLRF